MSPCFSSWLHGVACALLAGLAATGPIAQAQAAESDTARAPEPLRAAIEAAWNAHPLSRVIDAELAAAAARAEAASRPLYNPELELAADDEGGERTDTAGLSLAFDMAGKRRARADAATAQLGLRTAEAGLSRRDFVQTWLASWSELATARRRVELGDQRLGLVARFAELAERQFQVGDISNLDRDLALLARDEAQAEQASLLAT